MATGTAVRIAVPSTVTLITANVVVAGINTENVKKRINTNTTISTAVMTVALPTVTLITAGATNAEINTGNVTSSK